MTTHVKVTNSGHYPVVVNVWETDNPKTEGSNVERHDLAASMLIRLTPKEAKC